MNAPALKERTQKRGDSRRRALVQSAAESFWLSGYKATSLADIAERADVPLGNVYYYYKSKADLALAVADLFVQETQELVAGVNDVARKPPERLKLLVGKLRSAAEIRLKNGCPIAAATREFRTDAPEAAKRAAESFEILIGYIGSEMGRGGLRPSQSLMRARAAIAEWQGGIALAYALDDRAILMESLARMERLLGTASVKD